jgi:hypothetical protein
MAMATPSIFSSPYDRVAAGFSFASARRQSFMTRAAAFELTVSCGVVLVTVMENT